jgi:hypothetical protein
VSLTRIWSSKMSSPAAVAAQHLVEIAGQHPRPSCWRCCELLEPWCSKLWMRWGETLPQRGLQSCRYNHAVRAVMMLSKLDTVIHKCM